MKGRTLADQKKMKVGGVTKMQMGGSTPTQTQIASAKNKARLAARAENPMTAAPVPQRQGDLSPSRQAQVASAKNKARLAARPAPMPSPMKKGGMAYRKGGKC